MYAGFTTALYGLWYKDAPANSFHHFDDNAEWLQMDKAGHVTTAYYVGLLGIEAMKWTGLSRTKATVAGGVTGLLFLTSVEIFDGFSPKWGFSTGDMLANVTGAGMVISQSLAWNEQRIKLKFSFHQSKYASYRPNLLGKRYAENLIKDYNGQTYWLSANISSFLNKTSRFPKWLNLAFGYGAEGMISARTNPSESNDPGIQYIKRNRQYYLSLDVDLSRIPTKSRMLKAVFTTVGFIKFPAPALEWNQGGPLKFFPLYF